MSKTDLPLDIALQIEGKPAESIVVIGGSAGDWRELTADKDAEIATLEQQLAVAVAALGRLSTIQPNQNVNLGAAGASAMAYAVNQIAAEALRQIGATP